MSMPAAAALKRFRPWQQQAFQYTLDQDHPALFMHMRLGKTLVCIRRVRLYNIKPCRVLVVAPYSAIGSWMDDLDGEDESYVWLTGSMEKRWGALMAGWRDMDGKGQRWFLINKEAHLYMGARLSSMAWDVIILDESVFIKNARAKITKFFNKNFGRTAHRWILTGLPNPESDMEFYEQFRFLDGTFMGFRNFWEFRRALFKETPYRGWVPARGAKLLIGNAVRARAFIMSRVDAGVPGEEIITRRVLDFPPELRAVYERAESDFDLGGGERTVYATERYIWLRRLCGGWYKDALIWGGKFRELVNLLQGELRGEPVVVWFFFNWELRQASKALCAAGIHSAEIYGGVPKKEIERRRQLFQRGKVAVLLLQWKVAESGMNLNRADTAIYFSEPPGLHGKRQTMERIWDPVKTNPMLYIYLHVRDTVDEDIHLALKEKSINSEISLSGSLKAAMRWRRGGGV